MNFLARFFTRESLTVKSF